MKKQERIAEMYFYEWSVSRWHASETRALLDSAGRGVYREILDLCYVQGSIPRDFKILAKQCACDPAEIEAIWPIIGRHFFQDKRDKNRLRNRFCDVRRTNFFQYLRKQKSNAKKGGEAKANANNNISSSGSAQEKGRVGKGREDKGRVDKLKPKTNTPPPPSRGSVLDSRAQKEFLVEIGWQGIAKASEDQIAAIMKLKPAQLVDDENLSSLCMLNARLWWFDEFWKAYWNTDSKKQARTTFLKVVTTYALHEQILGAILMQTPKMARRPADKVPHASTWLNAARWEDPTEESQGGESKNLWH